MKDDLKVKLQNLSGKFSADVDVISLKALCSVPESEETLVAITEILNRLVEKYPDDEEILGLLPKKERPSLEDTIKVLEERYPGNVEVITLKALTTLPEGEDKENAVNKCMERLLEANEDDQDIMDYLGIEEKKEEKKYKEKLKDMAFVKGKSIEFVDGYRSEVNKYDPKDQVTIEIPDLYIDKCVVTQDEWNDIMGTNPSHFKGARRPVESITWIQALEYCNKLSEKHGLQPVYKIENGELTRIIYKNGEEVYPDLANFKKTEGYRLPTSLEWSWFSNTCGVRNPDNPYVTLDQKDYNQVAWCRENSNNQTHTVGTKKPNDLGLYDCIGNVSEWAYDTCSTDYISGDKIYRYDESCDERKVSGGSYDSLNQYSLAANSCLPTCGFRIVKTA